MYSFAEPCRGPYYGNDFMAYPLLMQASSVFDQQSEIYRNGITFTYCWPGLTCVTHIARDPQAIWTATDPDKILWLQVNTPEDATILEST